MVSREPGTFLNLIKIIPFVGKNDVSVNFPLVMQWNGNNYGKKSGAKQYLRFVLI